MMEVWNHYNSQLLYYFSISLVLLTHFIYAQEGFVSIRCCSDAAYTDPITNISWIGDGTWYPDKRSCVDIVGTEYKARSLSSNISKQWYYNLPTLSNQDYLVRGTFIGNLQSSPSSSFHVLVGVTKLALINTVNEYKVEGIFRATGDNSDFCLLTEKVQPFISEVELRPVSSNYLDKEPSGVLKLIDRVDAGNKEGEIRHPHDCYDRIWKPDLYTDPDANHLLSQTATIIDRDATMRLPPIDVLRTALTHLERVFDIYINNERRLEVDIVADGSRHYAPVLDFQSAGFLNLTMIKSPNGSQLGPICNAFEIFQVRSRNQRKSLEEVNAIMDVKKEQINQKTSLEEENAITDVKNELMKHNHNNELLISWSGDPCLPVPWQGLLCDFVNNASVITKIVLSSNGLRGPIPYSITALSHLRELDLRRNDFEGDISEVLTSLPTLEVLYFGCNPRINNKLDRLYRSNLTTDKGSCHDQTSTRMGKRIILGIVISGSVLVTIGIGICMVAFYRCKRMATGINLKGYPMTKNAVYSISSMDSIILKAISVQSFTLPYIETVTQKYKTMIGEGGFGSVYRGTLLDGQEVAVKVRSATSTQGTREFENELNLLSSIQHENLVPLLGYCSENDQQILVYPFMSNGSLQDRLYGEAARRKNLDWPTRLSIALGAARGLTYLHSFSGRCVLHRDVKSSNILLDHRMCAKVADFGFSKYAAQEGDSATSLEVRGTAGYLDPEYYSTQHFSAKSDVFSFGVVLLEIITGREPLNVQRPREEWSLVEWAKPRIKNAKVEEVVDPHLKGGYHAEAMWRVVEVALACTESYSANRPTMADIVRELEDSLIIENNASEYMRSIESMYSHGGSNRFSERIVIIPPSPIQTETLSVPIFQQPR
ncbi:hypothetical protein Leryth_006681 [Lithospermum erythrorhizon]|nr:hypothetical protein Leryth_006681 [Lithospermum erythrorhizon]